MYTFYINLPHEHKMLDARDIIKGERLQKLAGVYIGSPDDFRYNPLFSTQQDKCMDISNIYDSYDNPPIVFCYGHRISDLCRRIRFFQNDFVLITHNSDENIVATPEKMYIADNPKVIKWYAQNVGFVHPKVAVLPIGVANDQWTHGNTLFFTEPENINNCHNTKTEEVYFGFHLYTNYGKRTICYDELREKMPFLQMIDITAYYALLSKYKFCICPEGNGADTHRFWEALYVKTVPIVLNSPYIEVIRTQFPHLPIVVLQSWKELDVTTLHYNTEIMGSEHYYDTLRMSYFENRIRGELLS
jgi:hypothetical protein